MRKKSWGSEELLSITSDSHQKHHVKSMVHYNQIAQHR